MAQNKKKKTKSKAKTKTKTKPKSKPKPKAKGKFKAKPEVRMRAVPSLKASLAKFMPLDDRLVVGVEHFEKTAGGLFIPATVTDQPQRGKVVAVGRGHRSKKGKIRPMDVKVGDEILFAPYSGTKLEIQGQNLLILREEDVLGVVS